MNRVSGHIATGIDIGSDTVRVIQLRRSGHNFSVLKFSSTPLAELGRLEESRRKDARIAMVLSNVLKKAGIRPTGAISCVSSRRVLMKYTQIPPVPSWKLKMLMEYEIEAEVSGKPSEVATDFRLLDLPVFSDRYTVLMAMVQKEAVQQRLDMLREAGVKPDDITISPVAQYEAFVHSATGPSEGVVMLVAIGGEFTDVIFVGGGKFYFARTLPMGGRSFTDAVESQLAVNYQEAEELKMTGIISNTNIDDPLLEEEKVSNALLGSADKLASDIHSAILFCRAQTKMVDMIVTKIVLSGGGGMMKGLDGYLSERLELPTSTSDPLEALDLSRMNETQRNELRSNAGGYGLAIGLALTGLKDDVFFLSIFPEDVKEKRKFWKRDIFLWYAAAMFTVAVTVLCASLLFARFKRADYLKGQKKHLATAEEETAKLEKDVEMNIKLAARVAFLEERLGAGRDTVRALAKLKSLTPESIRLLGLETKTVQSDPTPEVPSGIKRQLRVKGLVKSPNTPAVGEEILNRYTEELREREMFVDAKILPNYAYRNNQVYFEMKLDLAGRHSSDRGGGL